MFNTNFIKIRRKKLLTALSSIKEPIQIGQVFDLLDRKYSIDIIRYDLKELVKSGFVKRIGYRYYPANKTIKIRV